jgi:hypothetical protein
MHLTSTPGEAKDKKIAYRASEDFRKRLQIAAIERGMKVQGLIDMALDAFLAADAPSEADRGPTAGPFSTITASERKFLQVMLDFYRVADDASIKLVRQHAAAMLELSGNKRQREKAG